MKSVVLCFAFVVIVSLTFIRVEGSSMPKCPDECNTSNCPAVDCQCGTYKDSCNCCNHCRVCPDQECHLIRSDVCAEGYSCSHPAGSDYMHRISSPGICSRSETPEE